MSQKKRALISVSDKTGIVSFADALIRLGFEIVSSGGTAKHLMDAGLAVTPVHEVTGHPEILGGRVKTLHPKIHGALLARYDQDDHVQELEANQIAPIQIVAVNLYPFAQYLQGKDVTPQGAVEHIDIGGPTMVRASAKNFAHVTIVTDPSDYDKCLEDLGGQGETSLAFRLEMARKAFQHTFDYDMRIASYFEGLHVADNGQINHRDDHNELPNFFRLSLEKAKSLRYGENPHQSANFYCEPGKSFGDFILQHQGKELSYNNLVDMEAAWACAQDFEKTTAVVVKHTNPCGVACNDDLETAFRRARKVDETSSFGGVIALNRRVDRATAKAIGEKFAEIVIAPEYDDEALKVFKKKKNLRVLTVTAPPAAKGYEFKQVAGGLLVQDRDLARVPFKDWKLVSQREPTADEIEALKMAWTMVVHIKSNAIVYADAMGALGIGAGQMSRVDSAKIGIRKAQEAGLSIEGCAMASDAFFPFRDSIDTAAAAGVKAIVEPGGSIRDDEVIAAAVEHGIALFFTGQRHFKH